MSESAARKVASAAELLRDVGVEIEGITFYSVSARVSDSLDGDLPEPADITPTYSLKTFAEREVIGVRLITAVKTNVGEIDVDVAVAYRIAEPVELAQETAFEFANEVGVMALLPYVREAVMSLSARVFGNAILMPVIQRGDLFFAPNTLDAAE